MGPDVVLVIGCTVRRDQTSLYGAPASVTPHLAALAAQGVRFDGVVSSAPWTRPAVASLLTGQHGLRLGLAESAPGPDRRALGRGVETLAERLSAAGWATVGITTNPNAHSRFGFDQGFDAYVQPRGLWSENDAKVGGTAALPYLLREVRDARAGGRPVFVQALWIDAHAPYQASKDAAAAFSEAGLPDEVAAYRVALHRLDDLVGSMLDGLWEAGLDPDETLVVFASDHGEGLSYPRHHGRAHGRTLSPSALDAVWLMRGPGIPAGHRVAGLASSVDLVPTLLGLLGLPTADVDGIDLSGPARGAPRTGRAHAFADTWFQDVDRAAIWTDTSACQRRFGGRGERSSPDGCFDRRADAAHLVAGPLGAAEGVLRFFRADATSDAGPAVIAADNEGEERALEALGYVE
jgi:arylsulfatase A-like enzyme